MGQILKNRRDLGPTLIRLIGSIWILLGASFLLSWVSSSATVVVEWSTATEVDTAGFFLYRSQTPEGEFVPLNRDLIVGKGNAQTGADYAFEDNDVIPGETYYYVLEEIEHDASANRYVDEMFSYRAPFRWKLIVSSLASVLVGLVLLMGSYKSGRS